jgi:hypothetical protein
LLSPPIGSQGFATDDRYRRPESGQLDGDLLPVHFALNAPDWALADARRKWKASSAPERNTKRRGRRNVTCTASCCADLLPTLKQLCGAHQNRSFPGCGIHASPW